MYSLNQVYIINLDQEINGIQCLYDGLSKQPLSYGLLLVQVDFLISKKKLDMALQLAKLAVTYAPSEYNTWAKLSQVYIEMGDFNSVSFQSILNNPGNSNIGSVIVKFLSNVYVL